MGVRLHSHQFTTNSAVELFRDLPDMMKIIGYNISDIDSSNDHQRRAFQMHGYILFRKVHPRIDTKVHVCRGWSEPSTYPNST